MTYGVLFAFVGPFGSPVAYVVIGIVILLLFGNRLPTMMRSLGRSFIEFKKGVQGIEEEIDEVVRTANSPTTAEKDNTETKV